MSGEVDLKKNKRSGGGSSSSKATPNSGNLKGGKGPSARADNANEGESLVGSHSSSLPSVKGRQEASSSSKGNICATNTSNSSLHLLQQANNQSPSHSPEKTWTGEGEAGGSSTSLSARLSTKSLSGKRRKSKSPVRTQFNLGLNTEPGTVGPASSSTSPSHYSRTGADQIPKDSISVPASSSTAPPPSSANISSVLGGVTVSNNNCSVVAPGTGAKSPTRSLLLKKERGASESPPSQRTHFAEEPKPALPSPSKASLSVAANPILSVKTEPADPNIPWIPGTSAPISVDRVHSQKITRKILHNWRSACGRTKDRTKDLIRRWKTLPENHPDFEKCPTSPGTSKKKGVSTSNLINNGGSPGLGKKKLDKSASPVKKVEPFIAPSAPSNTKANSPVAPTVTKTEPKVPVVVPPASTSTSTAQPAPTSNSKLQTNKSVPPIPSPKKQQCSRTGAEREMPVVGIGKGLSSVGGSDGTGGSANSHNPPSSTVGLGRLNSTMIGRPSISVNNPSSMMVNGRISGGDSSSGPGSGSSSGPSGGQNKSSTGWSVHVWATYVQRDDLEQGLENEEPKKPDREFLSDFQKVKLTHFFRHVLDMNHDDVISADDFVALNQRIRHYIEWSSECIEFHILKEVHSGFLECFLNQPLDDCSVMYYCNSDRETRQHVNIDEWLDVWGGLLRSARTMESLPLWLQYFPKILFQVINKSGSGTISREELRAFYTMFLGIDFRVVNESLEAIHKAMTDGGRHKITYDLFKLCFANFLLGKYPNGPGQYLFGICSPQTLECSFPIDYSALNTHPDDLEPYDPEKDKSQSNRRSVIV